jgi:hypothetical protein
MPIQQITTGIIQDGAVVATDIANGTVTGPKLGANSVSSNNIVSVLGSAITSNTVANSAIQTGAIENYSRDQYLSINRNKIINGDMKIDQRYFAYVAEYLMQTFQLAFLEILFYCFVVDHNVFHFHF